MPITSSFTGQRDPLPARHARIRISPIHVANVLFILMGADALEEQEPEMYKKMQIWYKLIQAATDEQIDKMMKTGHRVLAALLLGAVSCFKKDDLQELFLEGMEQVSEGVEHGEIKEVEYKMFCDLSKRTLEMLDIIDHYTIVRECRLQFGWTTTYTSTAEECAINIFVYRLPAAKA